MVTWKTGPVYATWEERTRARLGFGLRDLGMINNIYAVLRIPRPSRLLKNYS